MYAHAEKNPQTPSYIYLRPLNQYPGNAIIPQNERESWKNQRLQPTKAACLPLENSHVCL